MDNATNTCGRYIGDPVCGWCVCGQKKRQRLPPRRVCKMKGDDGPDGRTGEKTVIENLYHTTHTHTMPLYRNLVVSLVSVVEPMDSSANHCGRNRQSGRGYHPPTGRVEQGRNKASKGSERNRALCSLFGPNYYSLRASCFPCRGWMGLSSQEGHWRRIITNHRTDQAVAQVKQRIISSTLFFRGVGSLYKHALPSHYNKILNARRQWPPKALPVSKTPSQTATPETPSFKQQKDTIPPSLPRV